MMSTTWFSLALVLFAATACSNGEGPDSTTEGAGAGSSSSTGAGAAGAGGSGETVTFEMDAFTVPPGGEVYKCQNFANPFAGKNAEVSRFESHMTPGSHHLLLFYKDNATNGPLTDCSGLEFHATPYSTQLPDDSVAFPDGVAALIKPENGIRLQSHYLNTTGEDLTAHVKVTLHLAPDGTVTQHAGVLFVVHQDIDVPPASTATMKHDCTIPFDMNLVKAGSHMHKHGTHFTSTIGGETIFETTTWDEPDPALFDPAKPVKGLAPLKFECTFVNNSAETLTFGESAENNEMCIFVASYYPVPDDNLTTVSCF